MELFKPIAIVSDLPGGKGRGLVALGPIRKGEVIAVWHPRDRRVIDRVYSSVGDFEAALERLAEPTERRNILNHSWPTPDGKMVVLSENGAFGMINHCGEPTVLHDFRSDAWTTTACVDLKIGRAHV